MALDFRRYITNLTILRCQNALRDLAVLLNIMEKESLSYQAELLNEAQWCLGRQNLDGLSAILKCWEREIVEQKRMIKHALHLKTSIDSDLRMPHMAEATYLNCAKNDNQALRRLDQSR